MFLHDSETGVETGDVEDEPFKCYSNAMGRGRGGGGMKAPCYEGVR